METEQNGADKSKSKILQHLSTTESCKKKVDNSHGKITNKPSELLDVKQRVVISPIPFIVMGAWLNSTTGLQGQEGTVNKVFSSLL